ncbi:hypothetical protein IQ270_10115 [Microcoleus sp. LEGE 07076]|nr:hypothetical protein [Microcoleus sp. LEGE 07076]
MKDVRENIGFFSSFLWFQILSLSRGFMIMLIPVRDRDNLHLPGSGDVAVEQIAAVVSAVIVATSVANCGRFDRPSVNGIIRSRQQSLVSW